MERDLTPGSDDGEPGRPSPEVLVAGSGEYPAVAAVCVARELQDAADRGGSVSVALAGGSTPRPIYEELARIPDLPWHEVEVFFGDERAVPPDDSDSNFRMAREALLDRVPLREDRVHRMDAGIEDLVAAARSYERELPERLDLLLLGIGTDGHVASLFPGSGAVEEERHRVIPVEGPEEPRLRLTVTPPVIRCAVSVIVFARGRKKADAVAAALTGPRDPSVCPATLARDGMWILDRDAASALEIEEGGEMGVLTPGPGGRTGGRDS